MLEFDCPNCQTALDMAKSVTPGEKPSPGDVFVCGNCSKVSIFDAKGLHVMTEEEWKTLTPEESWDLKFAVRNIEAYRERFS